jgi:hypothetical protein
MFLMTVFRGHRLRIAARVFTISFLCAIFSYAFVVQSDYVTAWDHEKSFLTQAIMLSPDVYPDTLFVVEGTSLGEPLFPDPGLARRPSIGFQRHGLEVSMQSLFGHDAPTAFFCYSPEWKHYLQFRPDGKLHWTQARFDGGWSRNPDEPITPGHIIVLEERLDGIVLRKSVALKVDDRSVEETLDLPSVMKLESSWPKMPASPILPQVVAPYVMSATMVDGSEEPFLSARMSRPPLAAVRNSRDTAADGSAPAAQNNSDPPLISPAAGTVLIKSPVTFAWDAVAGAKDYWLDIGTVAGQGNIWSGFTGGATSRTVDVGKYLTGEPLYVQLYPKLTSAKLIPGAGRKYRFATQTTNVQLIAPPIGTTLTTSPVTFTWTLLQGAEDYWIDVGTAVGKGNIFAGYTKGANSATVNLRPYLNGKPLYVQLYAKFPGQAPPTPGTGTKFVYNTR